MENAREGKGIEIMYGVVTTGELWRFLELSGTTVRIDSHSYHFERIGKIMGILMHMVTPAQTAAGVSDT